MFRIMTIGTINGVFARLVDGMHSSSPRHSGLVPPPAQPPKEDVNTVNSIFLSATGSWSVPVGHVEIHSIRPWIG